MTKYFNDCNTEPQVRREYRKLAHKHHPDKPGGDKEIFQEILKQQKAALRRIAISEGKAESYYEELAAQVGKASFGKSIVNAAMDIEKKLEEAGVAGDFNSVFNAVAKMFYDPKDDKKLQEKSDPKQLPGTP